MEAGMNRNVQTEEAVKRLVAFFAPEQVSLFGSTARGEDRPDSDLDFLMALPEVAAAAGVLDCVSIRIARGHTAG
jgi:predicted nucleotidyltransferase